jgi:mRNA-degrading endonuclease toxin of MazEF toxin-antitoxin module
VWYAELRPGAKREQTGPHNVVIVSGDLLTTQTGLVVVAPITTTASEKPWTVKIEAANAKIDRESWIECDQLQTLAISRLIKYRGRLAETKRPYLALAIGQALRGILGRDD